MILWPVVLIYLAAMFAVGVWAGIFLVPRMWKLRVITTLQIFETFFGPSHRVVSLLTALMRDFGATAGSEPDAHRRRD
ncbi:MAG: hypothetical protein MK171_12200 [Pirellulales bacterium]|nr:hypothetical protein [Pirellulales bacterium]